MVRVVRMEWVRVLGVEAGVMVRGQITQGTGGHRRQEGACWKSSHQVRKNRA